MIKLTNLSMPLRFTEDILRQKIAQRLHISAQEIQSVLYLKRSVDARKKPKITVILTVAVAVSNEEKILRRAVKDADIQSYVPYYYRIQKMYSSRKPSKSSCNCGIWSGGHVCGISSGKGGIASNCTGTWKMRGAATGRCDKFPKNRRTLHRKQCTVWRRRCRNIFRRQTDNWH